VHKHILGSDSHHLQGLTGVDPPSPSLLLAIKLRSPVPVPISRTVQHPSRTQLQMADSKHLFLKTSLSMGKCHLSTRVEDRFSSLSLAVRKWGFDSQLS
jgi:hypothetical protein